MNDSHPAFAMSDSFLHGKVALVTGGTRGIGLGVARAFLAAGAHVLVTGQSERSVADVANVGVPARWAAVAADLASPQSPAAIVRAAIERFGAIDILVNNAGVAGTADLLEVTPEEWEHVHAVNLRAAFFCAREAATAMQARASPGVILNMSSVAAQTGGTATGPAYVTAKAGLIALTRSLARHYASSGIRVNCIAPADIDTDMTSSWPAALRERLIAMTPLGRFGTVDEVASVAMFLASSGAAFMTGQTINVNGGMYMG